MYTVKAEEKTSLSLRFKYQERAHSEGRLHCVVYNMSEGKMLGTSVWVELKNLSLHHKVASELLTVGRKQDKMSTLVVTGEFRHFLMSSWLGSVFNDFSSPSLEEVTSSLCRST